MGRFQSITFTIAKLANWQVFALCEAMSSHDELAEILAQLRAAVRELRVRGLKQAAKFASELVLGVPDELRAQLRGGGGAFGRFDAEDDDSDRYDAASASFDAGEFLRAHQLLASARCVPGSRAYFLRHYALFMVRRSV